jgi:hypothetical protein
MTSESVTPRHPPGLPRVRLGGPGELAAAIPFLLGFHPSESLVVLGLSGAPMEVCAVLRADLPPPGREAVAAEEAASALVVPGAQVAVIAVVTDGARPPELPRADLVDHVRTALGRGGIALLDAICVSGGQWWSYVCGDPRCCPPSGSPVAATGPSSSIAATFAAAGTVVLPSREALEAVLAPEEADPAVHPAFAVAERAQHELIRRRGARAAVRESLTAIAAEIARRGEGAGRLTAGGLATFCVALALPGVRDGCFQWIVTELAAAAENVWLELTRRAVPPYGAAPATILGAYAYARGNGAFARMCLDRALAADPNYVLAGLILDALDAGHQPADITRIAAALVSGGEIEVLT